MPPPRPRPDVVEPDDAALGLGDDLLRDDEDVPVARRELGAIVGQAAPGGDDVRRRGRRRPAPPAVGGERDREEIGHRR